MPARRPPASEDQAYRELRPPPALRRLVRCGWTRGVAGRPSVARILPDGCVDVVWIPPDGLVLAGPDTGPVLVELAAGAQVAGVRFRVGAAAAALGVPAEALRDLRLPLAAVWGDDARRLEADLAGARDASAALAMLEAFMAPRLVASPEPDPLARAAALRLRRGARVGALAEDLAVSERQLRRRVRAAVGYGPKTLERVLRFRRLVALVSPGGALPLAEAALEAGYADQAHMTRECRALAGVTPAALALGDGG